MHDTKMTDKNQTPADSPDSDFTNLQWSFELSEYLKFDDHNQWLVEDDTESFVSEHGSNQAYQANVSSDFGGGGSDHFEGSSSSKSSSWNKLKCV